MNKGDNRLFFYLAFLALAALLVFNLSSGKEQTASVPAEYVYWEEASSSSSPEERESALDVSRQEPAWREPQTGAASSEMPGVSEESGFLQGEKQYLSSDVSSLSSEPDEGKPEETPSELPEPEPGLVNLNTASLSELFRLNGIGEVLAGRIIEFRNRAGGFGSIEEIMEVSGIGEKKFAAIRDNITV